MKIRIDKSKMTTFKEITPGVVFTWIDANKYYMKTCYCCGLNAICLTDNTHICVDDDECITVVDCELVIK